MPAHRVRVAVAVTVSLIAGCSDNKSTDPDGGGLDDAVKPSACIQPVGPGAAPVDDPIGAGFPALPAGGGAYTITVDGLSRLTEIHVPPGNPSNAPLVIAFHSTGQRPSEWLDPASSQLVESAARSGVVVAAIAARGESEPNFPRTPANCDNASAVPGPFCDDSNPDHTAPGGTDWDIVHTDGNANNDLKLVRILIQRAKTDLGVDTSRVYTLGFSNGGFMSHFTALALHDRIAAFAQAGSGVIRCGSREGCIGSPPKEIYVNPRETNASQGSGSCAAIMALKDASWSGCDQTCGGAKKMAPVPSTGHIPHGFIVHDDSDDVVPPRYSCDAKAELGARAEIRIDKGYGHIIPEMLGAHAWAFLQCFNMSN
jgi:predicted esterase